MNLLETLLCCEAECVIGPYSTGTDIVIMWPEGQPPSQALAEAIKQHKKHLVAMCERWREPVSRNIDCGEPPF